MIIHDVICINNVFFSGDIYNHKVNVFGSDVNWNLTLLRT